MPQKPDPELSKSRFFAVQDGTVVIANQSPSNLQQIRRQPQSIIEKKYEILGMLGEGGMGAVFKAHHLMLNKDVALKTFRSSDLSEEARLRFQREAQAIAKLTHQNIVQIFDFGLCEDGVPYYTMEYLHGQTLADHIHKQGPLPVRRALGLFTQICRSLAFAHSKGIVHRDLKPANIFIESVQTPTGKNEIVKIVDFGIASLTNQSADGQKLTTSGIVFGSPLYMSPEQALGQPINEGADIYSLGCTLFETLTGRPPFEGKNAIETIMMHQTEQAPTLAKRSDGETFPPALERLVATMLAKSPRQRQQSMEQLIAELTSLAARPDVAQNHTPSPASPATASTTRPQLIETGGYARGQSILGAVTITATVAVMLLLGGAAVWFINSITGADKASKPLTSDNVAVTENGTLTRRDALLADTQFQRNQRQDSDKPSPGLTCKQVPGANGMPLVVFHAPENSQMGYFKGAFFSGGKIAATGTVQWPLSMPNEFCASREFIENPANVEIFPPNSVFVMTFSSCLPEQKDSVLLKHLTRMKWLTGIDFGETDFTDKDLLELDKLPHLSCLNLRSSPITGSDLARLNALKRIVFLEFCDCADAGGLLNSLARGCALKQLYLSGTPLNEQDFKTLSKISGLEVLQINKQSVTGSELAALTPLKNLRILFMDCCNVSFKEAMPVLQIMKKNGLNNLELSGEGMSPAERKTIRELIGQVKFRCEDMQHPEAVGIGDWKKTTEKLDRP